MALDEHTGTPPAVTHEKLVAWRKLGEDVTAALAVGGEQGLDLLTSLMSEWCEAVEDVNTAREICVNLAAEGRHLEALEWHADGFFEVADLLSTDRAGWDAWEAALTTRGIAVPAMSTRLKQLTDGIHEDLLLQDLEGRTFANHVNDLRRNVLAKDHVGERLTCLHAIQQLDPAGVIWKQMIEPIRRVRAGEIAVELRQAVRNGDLPAIRSIEREAAVTRWDDDMPHDLQGLLAACAGWSRARELQDRLLSECSALLEKGAVLAAIMAEGGADKLSFNSAYGEARQVRKKFLATYQLFTDALTAAKSEPVVKDRVVADGLDGVFREVSGKIHGVLASLDRAKEYWEWLEQFRSLEALVYAHARKAPAGGGDWDEIKARCNRWLDAAGDLLGRCRSLEAKAPISLPRSYGSAIRDLEVQRLAVEKLKRTTIDRERWWIAAIIGFILAAFGLIVIVAIVATMRG